MGKDNEFDEDVPEQGEGSAQDDQQETPQATPQETEAASDEGQASAGLQTKPLSKETKGRMKAKGLDIGVDPEAGDIINQADAKVSPGHDTQAKVYGTQAKKEHFIVEDGDDYVVWMAQDLKCYIGPDLLNFKKDQKYKVTKAVKDVLLERGVLRAL